MPSSSDLLQPDADGAAQVEAALAVLHQADTRMPAADRYLTHVRISPAAWPIACALIRSPSTTSAALMFAANTVYARLRSDWHAFGDEPHRLTAYALAVDGAARSHPSSDIPLTSSSPPAHAPASIHFFGRAVGFALALARDPDTRAAMWHLLLTRLSGQPARACAVLAAVMKEVDDVSTADAALHPTIRAFCAARAPRVVSSALALLHTVPSTGTADIAALRSAISCLHAWRAYVDRRALANALLRALPLPTLADDVADCLAEIVGYSGTHPDLLRETCDGLIAVYHTVTGTDAAAVVHHAIAEVACALSDGNADELMERHNTESKLVIQRATELLWMCLKSDDERSFFAAVDGWNNWIAAENLIAEPFRLLGSDQVAAVASVVVDHISSASFTRLLVPSIVDEDVTDYDSELSRVKDLLLATAASVGLSRYVLEILPILERHCRSPSQQVCAPLLALSVAGDIVAALANHVPDPLAHALLLVMNLLDWIASKPASPEDAVPRAAVRKAAFICLSSHTAAVARWPDDAQFVRAVRCAGAALLEEETCEHAGRLVYELAERCTPRLIPFLPELISSCAKTIEYMPLRASDMCTRALTRVASALPSHKERLDALRSILTVPCERVEQAWRNGKVAEEEEHVCRHLGMISTAMHEMNDNGARSSVFSRLRDAVVETAVGHSANGSVARAVCRLLETCVLPTLMDDEESEDDPDEGREPRRDLSPKAAVDEEQSRVMLAMSCASLAAECFQRSSPPGEACWLQAVADICPHIVSGLESGISNDVKVKAVRCLGMLLQVTLAVVDVCCERSYDTQPDMAVVLFKHAAKLIVHPLASHALLSGQVSSAMGDAALRGLRCSNGIVVRESLTLWKRTFARGTDAEVCRRLLTAAGGPKDVTAGILCAAHVGRLAPAATDTVFAMCTWVAGADGDAADVLRTCLQEAFAVDDVPRQGLDRKVKDMLFRGCVSSARSKREFRRALDEVGRVCAMAIR